MGHACVSCYRSLRENAASTALYQDEMETQELSTRVADNPAGVEHSTTKAEKKPVIYGGDDPDE